ncbi:hypothetical protein BSPLISOX_953 [uncultured Gammaproteobacteria bacterium]|nr:hypothetical protein [uncultured Gammaproteobacteria bacterium]VVH64808.1 hypothetical protein BSPLISOX_953 [uncultured Gammaproteobacteria bacterium]
MHSQNWRYGVIKLVKKRLFDNNIHLYLLEIKKSIIVALTKSFL